MEVSDTDFATPARQARPRPGHHGGTQQRGSQSVGSDVYRTPARSSQPFEFQTPSQSRRNSATRRSRPNMQRGEFGTPSSSQPFFLKNGQGNPYAAGVTDETYIFGAKVKVKDVLSRFLDFIRSYCEEDASPRGSAKYMELLRQTATDGTFHYCVDMQQVHKVDAKLYGYIISYPKQLIPLFDEELLEMCINELEIPDPSPIHFRPFNLTNTKPIRDLDPTDLHRIIAASGMVTRISSIIPEMKLATFQCQNCYRKAQIPCEQNTVAQPLVCDGCPQKLMQKLKHELSVFASKQVIKMQESPDAIPEGETPHTVTLNAYDEMVDVCRPGDRIKITGLYTPTPSRVNPNQTALHAVYRTFIEVLHVEIVDSTAMFSVSQSGSGLTENKMQDVEERNAAAAKSSQSLGGLLLEERIAKDSEMKSLGDDPLIYEKLVSSLAPSIWEMEDVKKGVLCQLFGGTIKEGVSEGGVRSDINILLVGDPGVSKSQLLTYVNKVSPRGIYTSGRGSSAVGLTAFIAKDPDTREMVLESGALVLSDTGICCIDEFDKMSENARSMLLEVMEQQTVSVAKAGIVSTLNARTSILASANPVGSSYNPDLTVVQNIKLPPALVSRFDLIYLLLDVPDEGRDQRLARHLIALSQPNNYLHSEAVIPTSRLKEYIAYARDHCKPKITQETGQLLLESYIEMRKAGTRQKTITATPRQLESFIRLSEALAKMQLKDYVEVEHVMEAVRLVKNALRSSFIDKNGMLDLDTMYTGVSQQEKKMRQLLANELKTILQNQSLTFHELLDKINQQSQEHLNQQSLRDALSMLKNDVTVGAGGRFHMTQQA